MYHMINTGETKMWWQFVDYIIMESKIDLIRHCFISIIILHTKKSKASRTIVWLFVKQIICLLFTSTSKVCFVLVKQNLKIKILNFE